MWKKMAQWQRKRYDKRQAQGLCGHCGKAPPKEGFKSCEACLTSYRKRSKNKTEESRTKHNIKTKQNEASIRQRVKEHYGGKCACCGESNPLFLTVDHVNNDGAAHRKAIGTGRIYRWLLKNQFPEGYQLLCWNCNLGKFYNHGVCPHKKDGVAYDVIS